MTKEQMIKDILECDGGTTYPKEEMEKLGYYDLKCVWRICCQGVKPWRVKTRRQP